MVNSISPDNRITLSLSSFFSSIISYYTWRGNTCAVFPELGKIFSDIDLLNMKYNGFTTECTVDFNIL